MSSHSGNGAFKSSAFIQNSSNFPFTLLPKVVDSIAFETPFKMLARLTYLELPKWLLGQYCKAGKQGSQRYPINVKKGQREKM